MAQIAASSHFTTSLRPSKSSWISNEAYVIAIASLPDHYAAAASAPSNALEIYDKQSLQRIQSLAGHDVSVSSLKTVDNIAGFARQSLVSSGHDGSVKVWDDRSNSHSIKNGLTVAAGSDLQGDDASIFYWDPRQAATPLRTHASTHSDDITSVRFGPENVLLSASTDGLISLSNYTEDDEYEAVTDVVNWGCSIAQAGWTPGNQSIWAGSDMETFGIWSGTLDPIQSVDLREHALHGEKATWVTDYLIACDSLPDGQAAIFTGSNEGDVALLTNSDMGQPSSQWYIHNVWSHGHVGVVRSLLWDKTHGVIVTGGEDSKLNVWLPNSGGDEMEQDGGAFMDVDSPSRKRRETDWNTEQAPKKMRF
ncbi:WD40 repeat-like protein [Cylindrobasidium torrendii FP15055 ss-10]|uniref:WD40 repeat-like protein n=1 Tax=Cylindrobasidium torrendii FP15055 ss-10 TaxID=1314674 RepID=A0A0D7BN00_9AGAR|nr:WD40 repeat-like protein [Cylindrobasidium torrendii FP15055 ss-10]